MTTATPHDVRTSRGHASTSDVREAVLSQLFLFAGPAVAFVMAVLFIR